MNFYLTEENTETDIYGDTKNEVFWTWYKSSNQRGFYKIVGMADWTEDYVLSISDQELEQLVTLINRKLGLTLKFVKNRF